MTIREFLFILPVIVIFPIAAFILSQFAPPVNNIQASVGRRGKVIAIELVANPLNRIIIAEPLQIRNNNFGGEDALALVSYGPIDLRSADSHEYVRKELSPEQWTSLETWRDNTCNQFNDDLSVVVLGTDVVYRVALICGNASFGRVFIINRKNIPLEVTEIMDSILEGN